MALKLILIFYFNLNYDFLQGAIQCSAAVARKIQETLFFN